MMSYISYIVICVIRVTKLQTIIKGECNYVTDITGLLR